MIEFTAEDFKKKFGVDPIMDDLERINCTKAGTWGHRMCGICAVCNKPRFMCDTYQMCEPERFVTEHGK